MSAVELAARLARKQVSARDVMSAHLAQIERVNPKVNAIVTLVADRAMAAAARADEAIVRGGPLGALHGLPVAHKDLVDTAGIRTTHGSPFYRDNVPTQRRAYRDEHARGRRDHGGQDQHAGVRRRLADVQYGVRRDTESVRRDEDVRRQQRRCGGRGCLPACCRLPTAAIRAARFAIRRRSATSSGCVRRRAACSASRRPGRRSR